MSNKRLMVLDDEKAFGEFVGKVAESMGFETKLMTQGSEFQLAYEDFDPDVIVLDIVMPEIDGIEIAKWLGQKGCRARLIVVTAYNPHYAKTTKTLSEVYGLKDVMTCDKPIELAKLREALTLH